MLVVAMMPYHWICPSSLPNIPCVIITPIPASDSSWGAAAKSGGCQPGDGEGKSEVLTGCQGQGRCGHIPSTSYTAWQLGPDGYN